MSEWQPIETAPKDETEILLLVQSGSRAQKLIRIGFWALDEQSDGYWIVEPFCLWQGYEVTHWMPLPEPPK